jgi:hypothetical protein
MFEVDLVHLTLVGLACLAAVLENGVDVHHQHNRRRESSQLN